MRYKKKDGSSFFLKDNSIAIINKQGTPIGTRIIGPIPKILKKKKFTKFVSIANGFYN